MQIFLEKFSAGRSLAYVTRVYSVYCSLKLNQEVDNGSSSSSSDAAHLSEKKLFRLALISRVCTCFSFLAKMKRRAHVCLYVLNLKSIGAFRDEVVGFDKYLKNSGLSSRAEAAANCREARGAAVHLSFKQ